MFVGGKISPMIRKCFSSQMKLNGTWRIEQLNDRSVFKLKGEKCTDFLQGLITNDMNLLNDNKSIYAMFLNVKGRILYDSIIYKTNDENTYLLDCDCKSVTGLGKHLQFYKVRRKIEISTGEYSVWAIFQPEPEENKEFKLEIGGNSILCPDPRLPYLGYRAVVSKDADLISNVENSNIKYKMHRYHLGIAEGIDELQVGKSFPLEMNCDYLNGVSFDKGCYIGQELTARTHHTGVVRKRVMPLRFLSTPDNVDSGQILETDSSESKSVGKLISVFGTAGLGLMRVRETLTSTGPLKVNDYRIKSSKPLWWPATSEVYAAKKNV